MSPNPFSTVRQIWYCDVCGTRSEVAFEPYDDAGRVAELIEDDHLRKAFGCTGRTWVVDRREEKRKPVRSKATRERKSA